MASVNDIYQLRMTTLHPSGEEGINLFYYRVESLSGALTAENVADEFISTVLPCIADILTDSVTVNRIQTTNGMDNSDFNDTNPSQAGSNAGQAPAAAFIAAAVRSAFAGPGTRRTYHRFMGVPSLQASGTNGSWSAAFRAELGGLCGVLDDTLVNANGELDPVQIGGGFVLGVSPTYNYSLTGQWQYDAAPTSQNSRKNYTWLTPT